jgi:sulfite reductase (NADPH) flavoprotein alpha-component
VAQLSGLQRLILITSTYGDGEPPDNIAAFYQQLHTAGASQLGHLSFCVLALGDHSYSTFCKAGKDFDARLAALGAQRLCDVVTCDTDYEATYQAWLGKLVAACAEAAPPTQVMSQPQLNATSGDVAPSARYANKKFFLAPIVLNNNLHEDGFSKYVRQVAFSLKGSGLRYEPGDALGVMPTNRPELVEEMLQLLGLKGDEAVPLPDGGAGPLCEALLHEYDISKPTPAHVQYFAERTGDMTLQKLLKPGNTQALKESLQGRQLIDLLLAHPDVVQGATDFVAMLGKLKPRLYSIASSQRFCPDEVHLTMGVVRYSSFGRRRHGVCSGDLARAKLNETRPIFVHTNKAFRLPTDPNTPIIMVGPGTGIAPFRSFLQERAATGAQGNNWLFFGCCNQRYDFLYRSELEQFQTQGLLTRFDVAFSRDQEQKIYVQHLMHQHAAELWRWLNEGAHFYVCGDAARMAKDVDAALHDAAMQSGGLDKEGAAAWVQTLRQQKRYLRDVY